MKKNILTTDEANKILKRLQKNAKPSKQLIEYVHNTLFRDAHFLFQYKEGKQRYGYCTYCKSLPHCQVKNSFFLAFRV